MSNYPVNGRTLSAQIKWKNKPRIVFIFVGGSCLSPSKTPGIFYLALDYNQDPEKLIWPVENIHCLIVWGAGPSHETISRVYECVKCAGAASVTITVQEYSSDSPHFVSSENFELKRMLARKIQEIEVFK